MSLLLAAFALGQVSCTIEAPELLGLACPCANGWLCDEARDVCVPSDAGLCGRPGASPGTVAIRNLERAWVTPNQIRWTWEIEDDTSLSHFELDIAASTEDLADGVGVRTYTSTDNPELARDRLRNSGAAEQVRATTTRGLVADTDYVGRLLVFDTSGGVSCSHTVQVRTEFAATNVIPIYEDAVPGGSNMPACFSPTEDPSRSYEGSAHYSYSHKCNANGPGPDDDRPWMCVEPAETSEQCFENLRVQNHMVNTSRIGSGAFQSAYVEMAVAIEDSDPAFWSEIGVMKPMGSERWNMKLITLVADGEYHLYQFPLRELQGQVSTDVWGPLTRELLVEGLGGFWFGSTFTHGAVIRIDSVRVRY